MKLVSLVLSADMNFHTKCFLCVMVNGKLFVLNGLLVHYCTHILIRLSYIVYALERLLENCQQHSRVSVLYDVACTLEKHLHVRKYDYCVICTYV